MALPFGVEVKGMLQQQGDGDRKWTCNPEDSIPANSRDDRNFAEPKHAQYLRVIRE
jgi:hypothetical protein